VEDNPDHALLLELVLREDPRVGQVLVSHFGEPLLRAMQADAGYPTPQVYPDLLLLDLKLAPVSGLALLRARTASAVWRTVPVCVISTSTTPAEIAACYAAGANDYLAKSGDLQAWGQTIRRRLSRWLRPEQAGAVPAEGTLP
jgi:two-component system response regulator